MGTNRIDDTSRYILECVMEMKEAFLAAAVRMWPAGLADAPRMHRDVVRVYSMGWLDAAIAVDARHVVIDATVDCKQMADPNWWPDPSWKWWS